MIVTGVLVLLGPGIAMLVTVVGSHSYAILFRSTIWKALGIGLGLGVILIWRGVASLRSAAR